MTDLKGRRAGQTPRREGMWGSRGEQARGKDLWRKGLPCPEIGREVWLGLGKCPGRSGAAQVPEGPPHPHNRPKGSSGQWCFTMSDGQENRLHRMSQFALKSASLRLCSLPRLQWGVRCTAQANARSLLISVVGSIASLQTQLISSGEFSHCQRQ